jgi:hypothetical protein
VEVEFFIQVEGKAFSVTLIASLGRNPLIAGRVGNPDTDLPHRIFRTRSFVEDDTTISTQIDSIF